MSWKDRKTLTEGLVEFDFGAIDRCIADMKASGFVPEDIDAPVRFSSQKQEEGSSEARQIGNITSIANRIKDGAKPRWIMECTADGKVRAISGFKYDPKTGKPVVFDENKALGAYIKKAKDGDIPAGTLVLVDEYDRWARAKPDDAFESVMTLLRSGVHFFVLHPKPLYMSAEDKDNTSKRQELMNMIERAHAYSASLQKKVKASYANRIAYILETGKKAPLGGVTPRWLKWDESIEDNKPVTAKFASVEKLATEFLANTPVARIPAILNDGKFPTLDKSSAWSEGTVRSVLKNPALAGTLYMYDGEVNVPNYYPRVVDKEQWEIIQARFAARQRPGGARDGTKIRNLWPGKIYCTHCGKPMIEKAGRHASFSLLKKHCRGFHEHSSAADDIPVCKEPRTLLYAALELHFFSLLLQKSPAELIRPKSELSRDAEIAKKQTEIAKAKAANEDYKSTFYDPQADAEQKERFKKGFAELQAAERNLKAELAELMKTTTPTAPAVIRGISEAVKLITGQDITSLTAPALVDFALSTEDIFNQLQKQELRGAALNALRMVVDRIEIDVHGSSIRGRLEKALDLGYFAKYCVRWVGGNWSEWYDLTDLTAAVIKLRPPSKVYSAEYRERARARYKGGKQTSDANRKRSEALKRYHAQQKKGAVYTISPERRKALEEGKRRWHAEQAKASELTAAA